MPDSSSRIIVLNGPGSVGKGSIARELQTLLVDVYLHVAMDTFLEMLPVATVGTPDGLQFEKLVEDGHPSIRAYCGPAAARALAGMRLAAGALAEAGNNLIIDEVGEGPEIDDYRQILAPYSTLFVGLTATLDVLEERERSRADRLIGLARWQHERVHQGIEYDVMLDTSSTSPADVAQAIVDAQKLHESSF